MKKIMLILVASLTCLASGCEKTKEVTNTATKIVRSTSQVVKKRVPILRDILEAAFAIGDAFKEWQSGESVREAIANAFSEFCGIEVENDLEEKLSGMTDHQINEFYEKNKELLDPLIDQYNDVESIEN